MTTKRYDASYYHRVENRFRTAGSSPADRSTARWVAKHAPAHQAVIEVGSGLCVQAQRLSRYFTTVIASDISDPFADAQPRPRVVRLRASAQDIPLGNCSVDALLAIDTLEHLPAPDAFFRDAHRVLRPQGVLAMRVPNTGSLGARHKRAGWFAYQDETHVSLWAPEDWRRALNKHGFTVVRWGTDTPWDTPYIRHGRWTQKLVSAVASRVLLAITPCLPWPYGENLVILARRNGGPDGT